MNNPIPTIEFHITEKCNYRCEYCVQGKGENNYKYNVGHAEEKTIAAFIRFISQLDEQYEIKLIGGEPLIHPSFLELVKVIAKNGHKLSLTTNFSFPLQKYQELVDLLGDNLVTLTASLHLSQINNLEDFTSKAVAFQNYKNIKTSFAVLSVMTEETYIVLKDLKDFFDTNGVALIIQHLKVDGEYVNYPLLIHEYMQSINAQSGVNIIKDKSFKGTICYTGYKFFNIYWDGSVKRCYNSQLGLESLGNINSDFKPYSSPIPCLSEKCTCILPSARNMIRFGETNYDFVQKFEKKYRFKNRFNYIKRHPLFFLNKNKLNYFFEI